MVSIIIISILKRKSKGSLAPQQRGKEERGGGFRKRGVVMATLRARTVSGRPTRGTGAGKLLSSVVQQRYLLLMLLPGVIWYVIFCYVPMPGVLIAFKEYKLSRGIFGSDWAGMKYFMQFVTGFHFWTLIRNTVCISALKILFVFPAPILFALLLNELTGSRFKRCVQTISYLPHFVSWVIVIGIFQRILSPDDGLLNGLLISLGIIDNPVNFLTISDYIWPVAVLTDLWKGVGYSSIIYLAALSNINPELYEAARIDGVNRLQQAWHITLPGIRPTIAILFIFAVGGLFGSNFEQMYLLGSKPVLDVAEVINTYIYRSGLENLNYSLSTAAGLFASLLSFLMLLMTNTVVKALGEDGIW